MSFSAELPRSQPGGRASLDAVRAALGRAYGVVLGGEAPGRALVWMLAQHCIETARGAAMWQWNVGNITAGKSWTGPVWRPSWYTVTEASSARDKYLNAEMKAGRAPSAFRAYASLDAGALDYMRLLASRFPSLLSAMQTSDDPLTVATAIQKSNYCPDCAPGATANTLAKFAKEFGLQPAAPAPAESGSGAIAVALAVLALVIALGGDDGS